jgi:hypothetical protein
LWEYLPKLQKSTFLALINNVVLRFSELGGTYPIGACSSRAQHISINKGDRATLNEMKTRQTIKETPESIKEDKSTSWPC